VDEVIEALKSLMTENVLFMTEMAEAKPEAIQEAINDIDDAGSFGEEIGRQLHVVARSCAALGEVPCSKSGMKKVPVSPHVQSILLHEVCGSAELVHGIHARKVAVALDLIDWEESGTNIKDEVKMASISPEKVKKSMATWIPEGQNGRFQQTMERLGANITAKHSGFWGQLTKVTQKFTTKDWTDMIA
jgi:hypothetical protein